ncbi:hypothetical protein BH11CYA1_BH11CYA1_08830 [soil metagenome]
MNQLSSGRNRPWILKTGKKLDYHWLFCDHSDFPFVFVWVCPELKENAWNSSADYEDSATEMFAAEPDQSQIALVRTVLFDKYYPAADVEELESSWQALQQSGAIGYQFEHLLIVKEGAYVKRFLASEWVQALPNLHHEENKLSALAWLNMETADETCAQPNCSYKRVKYGANCGRHHFEMLMKEPFPEHYLASSALLFPSITIY